MALEETGVKLIAEGASEFQRAIGDSDKALGGFSQGLSGLASSAGGFETVVGGALLRVGEMATEAFVAAGQAVGAFIGDSIQVAADYETTLNRFASVTGDSLAAAGMDIDSFSNLFLEMGAVTQFSAGEAAEAAVNLAKGGMDPATIAAGGLEAALGLAAAGELDLAEASEILVKQLGVWESTGLQAAEATDLLAQAANASTVNVDDLALGLSNVGGTAKAAGLSYEETVQTLALIAPGFSSASDAGTSFKTFVSRLIPTTDGATQAMMDLGLATEDGASLFFDAEGSFVGMEEATRLLQESTKDLSEEERLLAFNTIFGQDAIRTAVALSEAGAEGYNAMGESMAGAGTAAEQAAERNQGLNFAMESLRGSLETVQIVLGSALIPILTEFVNTAIIPAVNAVLEFAQTVLGSEDPLATLFEAINGVLPGFSDFANLALGLGSYIMGLINGEGSFANMAAAVALVPESMMPLFEQGTQIVNLLRDNLEPILVAVAVVAGGAVVAAIASATAAFVAAAAPIIALGAVVFALYKAWDENLFGIQDITKRVWEGYLQPAFASIQKWLGENVPKAIDTLKRFWDNTLLPAFSAAWRFISDTLIPTISLLVDWLTDNIGAAFSAVKSAWDTTLYPALKALYEFNRDYVNPIFQALEGVIASVVTLGINVLVGAWNTSLKPALEGLWGYISLNILPVFASVNSAFQGVRDKIADVLTPSISSIASDQGVIASLKNMFLGLITVLSNVKKWLDEIATTIGNIEIPSWLGGGSSSGSSFDLGLDSQALPGLSQSLSTSISPMVSPAATPAQILNSTRTNNLYVTVAPSQLQQVAFGFGASELLMGS